MATDYVTKPEPTNWWDLGGKSVKGACEMTSLGHNLLYEAMAEGRLVWTKVNNRRLISVRSLHALMAENQVVPSGQPTAG
jgi:hypothetical protein